MIRKFGKEGEQFSKKFNLFEILFRVKNLSDRIIGYFDLKYSRARIINTSDSKVEQTWFKSETAIPIRNDNIEASTRSVDLCSPNNENILLPTVGKRWLKQPRYSQSQKYCVQQQSYENLPVVSITEIKNEILYGFFFPRFEGMKSNLFKVSF